MAFGEFWNRCGTQKGNYMFIICGSATSWIIGNIIENTGSLYNRITSQIFLNPFSLKETEQFFTDRDFGWSRIQIAGCQMVFGGLPYFLDLMNSNESLTTNIDSLCFSPHALLKQESKRLLEATLRKSPVYNDILSYLSDHKYGIAKAECFEKLSIPKGTFSRAVDDLIKCGYIIEYKDIHKKGTPLFLQLIDPFLLFHYRFFNDNYSGDISSFADLQKNEGFYTNWRGHAFEILCLHHVEQIKSALGISGVITSNFTWKSERKKGGAQIDLVIERKDGITNICEMKFTDSPFHITGEYESKLLNKIDVFREETGTKQALKLVMICSAGISGTAHIEHISASLTLDDLFE